jgi:hypothetical protein
MEAIELIRKLKEHSDRVEDEYWNMMRCEAEELIDDVTPEVVVEFAKARADYDAFLAKEELTGDEPLFDIAALWIQDFIFADFTCTCLTD